MRSEPGGGDKGSGDSESVNSNKLTDREEVIVLGIKDSDVNGGREQGAPACGWRRLAPWLSVLMLIAMIFSSLYTFALAQEPRVIQLTADKDNRFKVAGQKEPAITVKAKEVIKFRITAHKGTESDPDGAVHSFSVKELKDQGWDVRLKEGMNEFVLVAPEKSGEYKIECTVKCGKGHDDMGMKMIVTQ